MRGELGLLVVDTGWSIGDTLVDVKDPRCPSTPYHSIVRYFGLTIRNTVLLEIVCFATLLINSRRLTLAGIDAV